MIELAARRDRLGRAAGAWAVLALDNVTREFPHALQVTLAGPGSVRTARQLHPAFYGSFDWHSSVEMHWVLVRLLRLVPDSIDAAATRAVLDRHLGAAALAAEAAFVADPAQGSFERPYGLAWLLTLAAEVDAAARDGDAGAGRWAGDLGPLVDVATSRLNWWLTHQRLPVRSGVHPNSAFSLSRAWESEALRPAIAATARRWYGGDRDYPGAWEPSGTDFLSGALCEAEIMSRSLRSHEWPAWLDGFLPGLGRGEPAALLTPVSVSDDTDGHLAHLHGLNLSRAWCWVRIHDALPDGDVRRPIIAEAVSAHAAAGLPAVAGHDYAVGHWLAAYGVLLLGEGLEPGGLDAPP